MVDHISTRYDQQLKLSQNCQKYEREEDELIEARISSSIGIAFARYKLYYNIIYNQKGELYSFDTYAL